MAIEHKRLGKHGVLVSNLCLGTANFGGLTSEEDCWRIMDRALELGINFFDTSDIYGGRATRGLTEEIIGRWLGQGKGRREGIVLATKVFFSMEQSGDVLEPNVNSNCLSGMKVKRNCADSLRRLGTDWIDLYQMHHIDRACPWDEIWQACGSLLAQGKVVYVGSSNFAGWDIATACQEASRRGLMGLVSEQSMYSLNNRHIESEVIPACRHYGLGLMPWSPLGGGLLAGSLGKAYDGRRKSDGFRKLVAENRDKLEKYETLCGELGEAPAAIGLAWLLHNPMVTAPIIGPRTVEQLESAIRATEISLDAEVLSKLDEIFPGPGGEAPAPHVVW